MSVKMNLWHKYLVLIDKHITPIKEVPTQLSIKLHRHTHNVLNLWLILFMELKSDWMWKQKWQQTVTIIVSRISPEFDSICTACVLAPKKNVRNGQQEENYRVIQSTWWFYGRDNVAAETCETQWTNWWLFIIIDAVPLGEF
jgi:hypothetical protein